LIPLEYCRYLNRYWTNQRANRTLFKEGESSSSALKEQHIESAIANDAVRCPRLLVLSRIAMKASRAREEARFSSLVEAANSAGLAAKHVFIDSADGLVEALARFRPDIAFCSFFRFDGGTYLRESLIEAGIAWIGSSSEVMELALSKPRMKTRWRSMGIPTPDWHTVRKSADGSLEGIELLECMRDFPYIVKPANEGNSRGIDSGSIARSAMELYSRSSLIAEEFGEALVERFVSGAEDSREFTVAMIGNGSRKIVSAIEIRKPSGSSLVTEEDKEAQATSLAPIGDARLNDRVEHLARRVFASAGARDYARCDILLHEGKLYAIEMNGQPMVPDRWFEACACEAGLDSRQYLCAILLSGIVGNAETGHAFIPIPREMERILPRRIYEKLSR
jgi:D-alanine-D-alanine ligase